MSKAPIDTPEARDAIRRVKAAQKAVVVAESKLAAAKASRREVFSSAKTAVTGREVARQTGLSSAMVSAIISGRR